MKFSVIVPIYNVEKYLEKCLSSIKNQTYKNFEVIMVNDGSPDNCQKIIENRDYTKCELEKLGFLVLDSKANFLFAKSDNVSGEKLYLKLKDKGVLVRHFTSDKIKEFNRITIGSREQMESFIAAVKEILGENQ